MLQFPSHGSVHSNAQQRPEPESNMCRVLPIGERLDSTLKFA